MENKQAALSWARGGCPILQNFEMHDKELTDKCHGFMREKLDTLAKSYQGIPVILFSRAAMYLDTSRGNNYRTYIAGQEHLQGQKFINAYTSEYAKLFALSLKIILYTSLDLSLKCLLAFIKD